MEKNLNCVKAIVLKNVVRVLLYTCINFILHLYYLIILFIFIVFYLCLPWLKTQTTCTTLYIPMPHTCLPYTLYTTYNYKFVCFQKCNAISITVQNTQMHTFCVIPQLNALHQYTWHCVLALIQIHQDGHSNWAFSTIPQPSPSHIHVTLWWCWECQQNHTSKKTLYILP